MKCMKMKSLLSCNGNSTLPMSSLGYRCPYTCSFVELELTQPCARQCSLKVWCCPSLDGNHHKSTGIYEILHLKVERGVRILARSEITLASFLILDAPLSVSFHWITSELTNPSKSQWVVSAVSAWSVHCKDGNAEFLPHGSTWCRPFLQYERRRSSLHQRPCCTGDPERCCRPTSQYQMSKKDFAPSRIAVSMYVAISCLMTSTCCLFQGQPLTALWAFVWIVCESSNLNRSTKEVGLYRSVNSQQERPGLKGVQGRNFKRTGRLIGFNYLNL